MYRTNLKRAFAPWQDFWVLDNFFKTPSQEAHAYPAVSTWKDDEKAVVELELPGIDPAEVELSVEARKLTISGERKAPETAQNERYQYRERWHGKFTRHFELPYDVESKKVAAVYKNGILTVTLPRAEADKPRRIEVTLN